MNLDEIRRRINVCQKEISKLADELEDLRQIECLESEIQESTVELDEARRHYEERWGAELEDVCNPAALAERSAHKEKG